MATQLIYRGKRTAKSILFELWDDDFDEPNDILADELGISLRTVRSYRVEWRKKRGMGVKKLKVIWEMPPVNGGFKPFETRKGIVWCVPIEEQLQCDRCKIAKECKAWVCGRPGQLPGYLGCEKIYEEELWDDHDKT